MNARISVHTSGQLCKAMKDNMNKRGSKRLIINMGRQVHVKNNDPSPEDSALA